MPQTALELSRLIRHTLGDDPPSEVPAITLINEAGEMLVSMRRWNWLQRPDVALNLVAAQDYVTLPTDFSELVALTPSSDALGTATPASPAQIRDLRSSITNTPTGSYWYALEWLGSAALAAPTPRLAIWPTPTSSTANALYLRYRAGWTRLSADTDVAVVPSFCDTLLRQLVIIYARGYIEEDEGGLPERFQMLAGSSLFKLAAQRDAVSQPNLGPMRGGAVDGMASGQSFYNPDTHIPGPSNI